MSDNADAIGMPAPRPPFASSIGRIERAIAGLARVLLVFLVSCQATSDERPRERMTLPFRVLLAGGAFIDHAAVGTDPLSDGARPRISERTFPPSLEELFSLEDLCRGLDTDSVFVATARSAQVAREVRADLAASRGRSLADSRWFAELRAEAERVGADLILDVEGVRDGPVTASGTNGQWPISVVAWITIGLGMFIPDHTFESGAVLSASLRDPEHGRAIASFTITAPSVDLSLVERADFLGILISIIVPPPLMGSDEVKASAQVGEIVQRSLLQSLVSRLRTRETLTNLVDEGPVRVSLGSAAGRRPTIEIQSDQDIGEIRLLRGGQPLRDPPWDQFVSRLLASARRGNAGGPLEYGGVPLPELSDRDELRVLVRTVRGDQVSRTFRLATER